MERGRCGSRDSWWGEEVDRIWRVPGDRGGASKPGEKSEIRAEVDGSGIYSGKETTGEVSCGKESESPGNCETNTKKLGLSKMTWSSSGSAE